MGPDQSNDLQLALSALSEGKPQLALGHADRGLASDPANLELLEVKSIALAQDNRPFEALTAFQELVQANPYRAKSHYNLATHYYHMGMRRESWDAVSAALRLDPNHASARDLLDLLQKEAGELLQEPTFAGPPQKPMRPVALPWIASIGWVWPAIGIALVAGSITFFGIYIAEFARLMPSMPRLADVEGLAKLIEANPGLRQASQGLTILGAILVAWVAFDSIHRRLSPVWLVSVFASSCCGLAWIPAIIYMIVRKYR